MATRKSLQATVGVACAATLLTCVPRFEGTILRGYRDPIGIVTACSGHTATAVLGRPYTPEECQRLLVDDLVSRAEGVDSCLDGAVQGLPVGAHAAAISFAFNVGVPTFCQSTMARLLLQGDIQGACAQLPRWVYAGGKPLPGLVKRRQAERDICEGKATTT